MASDPITSWQIEGGKVETVTDFIFLGSRITVDGDSSYEIKRNLLLGRKTLTNLDSVLKSRNITLPTKVSIIETMIFPVVIYGCESWTIKKARFQRIDVFKLTCWRRPLRVPWTARRSNQSILKEINPEHSIAGLTPVKWASPRTGNLGISLGASILGHRLSPSKPRTHRRLQEFEIDCCTISTDITTIVYKVKCENRSLPPRSPPCTDGHTHRF